MDAGTVSIDDFKRQKGTVDRLATFSAADLYGQPVPEREWIVEEMIPSKVVTILSGDGGTGKTLLALQLAVAVTSDTGWCGREVAQGKCLFLSAEDDRNELHRRLTDIAKGVGIHLNDLRGLHLRSLVGEDALLAIPASKDRPLKQTPLFTDIDKWVAAERPLIVFIDTLADAFGGEENNRSHARQFIGHLRGLCERYGSTVILLAHPSVAGMASGTGTSGSTGWNNSVRSRLYFDRPKSEDAAEDPDMRVLKVMKSNYGRIGMEIRLRWEQGMFKTVSRDSGFAGNSADIAEIKFMELLRLYAAQGRDVGATTSNNSAPVVFAKDPARAGVTKTGFYNAMTRLFASNRIRVEEIGPASKRRKIIVEVMPTD